MEQPAGVSPLRWGRMQETTSPQRQWERGQLELTGHWRLSKSMHRVLETQPDAPQRREPSTCFGRRRLLRRGWVAGLSGLYRENTHLYAASDLRALG